jgi:peroxiredoxin
MVMPNMSTLRWGQPAPGFSLPSTLGRPMTLDEHHGKDVVLAFYCYDWGNI